MDDQIVSREQMRARGREAHAAGKGRDEHNMNPWAPAVKEWQAGWDEENNRASATGNDQLATVAA